MSISNVVADFDEIPTVLSLQDEMAYNLTVQNVHVIDNDDGSVTLFVVFAPSNVDDPSQLYESFRRRYSLYPAEQPDSERYPGKRWRGQTGNTVSADEYPAIRSRAATEIRKLFYAFTGMVPTAAEIADIANILPGNSAERRCWRKAPNQWNDEGEVMIHLPNMPRE